MTYIFFTLIGIFTVRFIYFFVGLLKEYYRCSSKPKDSDLPFVSVVVPARNEDKTVRKSIESIAENKYPRDKFEIIVVNDRSEDRTQEILDELSEKYPNLIVLRLNDELSDTNLRGKPRAIQAAIDIAVGSVILMTDADCTVNEEWIYRHAKAYAGKNTALTASFSVIEMSKPFDALQSVEWIYLSAIAGGSIGNGVPLSCYGNNMSISKSQILSIGGYQNIPFSVTEDLALLQEVYKRGGEIRFIADEKSQIMTKANSSFKEYLQQHHRWVIGASTLGIRAFVFVLSSVSPFLGALLSLLLGEWLWLSIFIGGRILMDSALIKFAAELLKIDDIDRWILPSIFFFVSMELLAPFMLLKRTVNWKGQKFKAKKLFTSE